MWCNPYRHVSICANFSFNFLKVVRDQRWPTARLFVVNMSPSFRELTAPLRHILPHHNVTINSNNLFVHSPFAFRDLMTERASHLVGLWIGAAISNTSHSKTKLVLPLSNEHGSQVEEQGRRQCCHNKHKKFPYRPTRDVSLLSGHASCSSVPVPYTEHYFLFPQTRTRRILHVTIQTRLWQQK
jgi:hypothetical protein